MHKTTISGHSRRPFATTLWSLAIEASATPARDARGALVDLCLRYWYPVYAYVRRRGHAPRAAQDIARVFLRGLFAMFREDRDALTRGQFRTYLLDRLDAFLAGSRDGRSHAELVVEIDTPPADLEERYQHDHAGDAAAESVYQRSFALEVFARAFRRLRGEAEQLGNLDMYDALQPHIALDPGPGEYERIAARLHRPTLALAVALKRLRQRFRELIVEELADTVASADELRAEQHALHAALRDWT
jgi:RNA polymerase sigma-70 factor (ECF subfamily)